MKPLIFALILSLCPVLLMSKGVFKYKYYRNGNIKYEYFKQKDQTIRITHYYKSGSIKAIGHYKKGDRHGLWQEFNEDGTQTANAFYFNDEKDGFWTFYDKAGTPHCTLLYKENKILRVVDQPMAIR